MVWHFPLLNIRGLQYDYSFPRIKDDHPGAFGAIRKFDVHTGVDLYCKKRTPICAVEDGEVVEIEIFTGPRAESPWWHETHAILVEGESGVVCYGEVDIPRVLKPRIKTIREEGDLGIQDILDLNKHGLHQSGVPYIKIGQKVKRGELITWAKQVLVKDKGRPMCMLHFELYKPGTRETVWWRKGEPRPQELLDPSEKLIEALKIAQESLNA